MGVGVAVGVAVGVLVGVAIAVGKGVALGAGVDVGADAGAQADKIRLTSKSKTNVRFIVRFLLWRSMPPNGLRITRRRAERSERSVSAGSAGYAAFHESTWYERNFKNNFSNIWGWIVVPTLVI
jgi:hypothetical protein